MEPVLLEIPETAHALRRAFDRRATRLGVTRAQWRVLVKLSRNAGARQVDLAEMLEIEPITLCRIIDRLEDARLVARQRDPSDRRAWRLVLTEESEPLMLKLRALADELSAEAFAGLSDEEIETVQGALAKVRANVASSGSAKRASNE